jgi:hypothetical protein
VSDALARFRPFAAFLAVLFGCSAAPDAGFAAFREGRLPAAVAELRAAERDLAGLSSREQAHYALQRGLAELGLGNAHVADTWLSRAKRADAADHHCFAPSERGRLLAAWRSLGRMPGENR